VAIAASITKDTQITTEVFPLFALSHQRKDSAPELFACFLGEVAAVGWKPCGATLLGFDVDKGCHGETGRPKTMPRNRGLFTG